MDLLAVLLLGVVQGVTEWLPVSSSAQNLLLMLGLLKMDALSAFSFNVVLHVGTLLAAAVRFRNEISRIFSDALKRRENRLTRFIVIATFFSALSGLPIYIFMKDFILEFTGTTVTLLIGLLLIATGFVLHYSKGKSGLKDVSSSSKWDGVITGIFQGIAVLPGISRSGLTSAVLFLRGFKPEEALKLTFIISIPAVFGLAFVESVEGGLTQIDLTSAVVGITSSFIVGYAAIDVLMKISSRLRFDLFCILFGLLAFSVSVASLVLK
jgi:undecaprenyl-diphosphatase